MALGNIVESFFVYLGFEIGEEELHEWGEKVQEAEVITTGIGVACLAAAGAVAVFVNEMAESLAELGEFAELEETNVEGLQELGFAASVTGSNLGAVESTITSLNRNIGEAVSGLGRGAMVFKKLGLEAREANGEVKTADQLLTEMSGRFQRMSRQQALGIAGRLGIDRSLVVLMQRGSENLANLREEARKYGVVTKEQTAEAIELKESWVRLQYVTRVTGAMFASKLIPVMLRVVESLREWFLVNRELISGGLETFIKVVNAVLGTAWDWLTRLIGVVYTVIKYFLQWRVVSYLLLAIFTAMIGSGVLEFMGSFVGMLTKAVKWMSALEFATIGWSLLLGGAAVALALLVDDLWAYYHGNDSLVGQLLGRFPHALTIAWTAVGLLTTGIVALGWSTVTSMASAVIAVVQAAAQMIPAFTGITLSALGVEAPLWAILAVLALLGFAAYEVWKHWDFLSNNFRTNWATTVALLQSTYAAVRTAIEMPFVTAFNAVRAAVLAVEQVWDETLAKMTGTWQRFSGAISGALAVAGLGASLAGPALQALPTGGSSGALSDLSGPLGQLTSSGVLGRSASTPVAGAGNSSTSTTTVTVHAPVTVQSPDPDRAGEVVGNELGKKTATSLTRNGQTAVLL